MHAHGAPTWPPPVPLVISTSDSSVPTEDTTPPVIRHPGGSGVLVGEAVGVTEGVEVGVSDGVGVGTRQTRENGPKPPGLGLQLNPALQTSPAQHGSPWSPQGTQQSCMGGQSASS